jgi:hypothetical protein
MSEITTVAFHSRIFRSIPNVHPEFYAVYQHYEFAGKDCPFPTIKAMHQQYVDRAREIMKQHQTGGGGHEDDFTPFEPVRTLHAVAGALLRNGASRQAAVTRPLAQGDEITCDGFGIGQFVVEFNSDRWLRTTDSPAQWIHSSGVREEI